MATIEFNYRQKRYQICAKQIDAVEKKPLQHFMSGTNTLTIACFGCDFKCSWCCNEEISQPEDNEYKRSMVEPEYLSATEVCDLAEKNGCKSIAFSFTEPTIWHEYALYIAEEAHKRGLKTIWKSNGFRTAKIIPKMIGLIDAANIDIKYFSDADYSKFCGKGITLRPVLDTVIGLYKAGVHVEISTIMMPTMTRGELSAIARWIRNLSPNIPWHVNRFHCMNSALTNNMGLNDDRPQFSSNEVIEIGHQAGLKHVYSFEKRPWAKEREPNTLNPCNPS